MFQGDGNFKSSMKYPDIKKQGMFNSTTKFGTLSQELLSNIQEFNLGSDYTSNFKFDFMPGSAKHLNEQKGNAIFI